MVAAGELWSVAGEPLIVCVIAGQADYPAKTVLAVVVAADDGCAHRVGDELVVRVEALSQRWTVKPLTGVAREVAP